MPKSADEYYEEAKKLIGWETPPSKGRYRVERDPIRRHSHMTDDLNPLYLDPEYAKNTDYGDTPCPPPQMIYFAGNGIWPPSTEPVLPNIPMPGNRAVNMTVEAEWFKPVLVGEQLYFKQRIADIYIKGTRLDPKCFWIVTERIISNEAGEVVCIERNFGLRHRTPEQIKEYQDAGLE